MFSIKGLVEAQTAVERIERSMKQMEGMRVFVGSRFPYAYGIETGIHEKSGTLARSAGGVRMLGDAVDEMLNNANPDFTQGMQIAKGPGPWILKRMALWVRRLARASTPRGGGTRHPTRALFKSIRMFTVKGL